ncbi:MAG: SpoIID/LytB domain-containing protein [Eubacteriales bacterium]
MKQAFKKITTIILFLLLFPYTLTLLTYGIHTSEDEYNNQLLESQYVVVLDSEIGSIELSLEEYLIGALASSIEPSYELAALQAQAIILRTNHIMSASNGMIQIGSFETSYFDADTRRSIWGENYNAYEEKFYEAVGSTAGMVGMVDGALVNLPFHAVSAGNTRDANEVFNSNLYSHCKSVECEYDIMASDYLHGVYVTNQALSEVFGTLYHDASSELVMEVMSQDQAGYVLSVQVGDALIAGEEFREIFQLASSNFTIQYQSEGVLFSTKGLGHGMGMSQYTANKMAVEGRDVLEILTYFYQNLKIELCV